MSKGNDNTGAILGSILIGAVAGAAAALLLAPQSGSDTRQKLMEEADRLKKELDEYTSDFSGKAKKVKEELEEKLKRTEDELREVEDNLGV